jgi:hypothetical protein
VLTCVARAQALNLNVKGEGYAVHARVGVEGGGQEDGPVQLKPGTHVIDMGDIYLNESRVKTLSIVNAGRFNFDYLLSKNQTAKAQPVLQISGGLATSRMRVPRCV